MKVYLITVTVIDFENMGAETISDEIERCKYCNPQVRSIKEAEIGEWDDDHPLNKHDTCMDELRKLFPDSNL